MTDAPITMRASSGLTLSDVVSERARERPNQIAIMDPVTSLTNLEWEAAAEQVRAALHVREVGAGDRVMFVGRNQAAHPVLFAATSRAGATLTGANWRLSPRELAQVIGDCGPAIVFADHEFTEIVRAALNFAALRPPVVVLDPAARLGGLLRWADGSDRPPAPPAPAPDHIALISYTSGTTGTAKGVLISAAQLRASTIRPNAVRLRTDTRFLVVLPLFHMAGVGWVATIAWTGGTVVFLPNADPLQIANAVSTYAITDTMLVPALIQMVMDDPRVDEDAFDGLRSLSYGASPTARPTREQMMSRFTAVDFNHGYGLSETVGPVSALTPTDHRAGGDILESVGRALPGIQIKVVDSDTGAELADGQIGEIWTCSDQNCAGYFRRPQDTQALFAGDWLRTGDLGRLVNGMLFITGRIKDMIITAGENVYAIEVEGVLVGLPGVKEACVVGVPHPRWGETVVAAVVADPTLSVEQATLISGCRDNLAHYKCPAAIRLVSELPRNATGKVLRHAVRQMFNSSDNP
jgi:long-chain acyl-CoA synthetase